MNGILIDESSLTTEEIQMSDGSIDHIDIYEARGMGSIQGMYIPKEQISTKRDVILINKDIRYPNVRNKKKFVKGHEKMHKKYGKRNDIILSRYVSDPRARHILDEYMTRMAYDERHDAEEGEKANTVDDLLRSINRNFD